MRLPSWQSCSLSTLKRTQIAGAPAGIPSLPGAQVTSTCSLALGVRMSVAATTQRGSYGRPPMGGTRPGKAPMRVRPRPFWLTQAPDGQAPRCRRGRRRCPPSHTAPPTGRGVARLAGKEGSGRCAACGRSIQVRLNGILVSHKTKEGYCPGSGQEPGEPVPWHPGCHCGRASLRTACDTVIRRGLTIWGSATSCSPSAWDTRCPACGASTAT